jgi:hypothetical protein
MEKLPPRKQGKILTWVSGGELMTGAQQSYLKTLSDQADQPDVFAEDLTKAEASKRIDELRFELSCMRIDSSHSRGAIRCEATTMKLLPGVLSTRCVPSATIGGSGALPSPG